MSRWHGRRHARDLAAKRDGVPPATLIDLIIADGVAEPVAEFVWDALGPYYGEGDILPHPDDGLTEDANIDPEDVEDMVANFFRQFSLPEPTPQHPEFVPASMSISTLAHYLDERLRTFRNQIPPLAS
ncbi:hypothetical protein [Sphingobium sp. WCS2017Hpa-17]|uniref:hypothetical protein n=1 Tax=Sphingobium sp. WCS2017Hpa-17 TaxID=3073638 RepID=UPI0028890045|nr:hypothetical protein [Sphingobium sp. WCS2017Hpa-17]